MSKNGRGATKNDRTWGPGDRSPRRLMMLKSRVLRSRRFDKNEQTSESSEREGKADGLPHSPEPPSNARVHYSSTTTSIDSTKGAPCACVTPACVRSDSGSETRRKVEEEGREDLRFVGSRGGKGGSIICPNRLSYVAKERQEEPKSRGLSVERSEWKEARRNVKRARGK